MASLGEMSAGLAHEINNPLLLEDDPKRFVIHQKGSTDLSIIQKNTESIFKTVGRIEKLFIKISQRWIRDLSNKWKLENFGWYIGLLSNSLWKQ